MNSPIVALPVLRVSSSVDTQCGQETEDGSRGGPRCQGGRGETPCDPLDPDRGLLELLPPLGALLSTATVQSEDWTI